MAKRKLIITIRDEDDRTIGEAIVETDYSSLTVLEGDPFPKHNLTNIELLQEV